MGTSISERHLETALRVLFPGRDISVNERDQSILRGPKINLELDFWIPGLQLAFEFQDSHHYVSEWYSHYTMVTKNRQDKLKAELARKQNISLVIIPCWWDTNLQSLTGLIHFERPDLLDFQPPIPLLPPFNFLRRKASRGKSGVNRGGAECGGVQAEKQVQTSHSKALIHIKGCIITSPGRHDWSEHRAELLNSQN
eukprot:Phypoly_transcript_08755.p1 GENE.Phypoly_transcript_08755~~Phypoly_transcript_08755.p1  ORF type:complete len:197 (+),score=16.06 Phypoly_transcript_08755:124-714(+)